MAPKAKQKKRKGKYSHIKRGRAPDLGDTFFRSAWERNYARVLNLWVEEGVIADWSYEPQTFYFTEFGYKSGPWTFRPDFLVDTGRGVLFHEVKGVETGSDRRKWFRFRKHTGYELQIIDAKKYRMLEACYAPRIEHWESSGYTKKSTLDSDCS